MRCPQLLVRKPVDPPHHVPQLPADRVRGRVHPPPEELVLDLVDRGQVGDHQAVRARLVEDQLAAAAEARGLEAGRLQQRLLGRAVAPLEQARAQRAAAVCLSQQLADERAHVLVQRRLPVAISDPLLPEAGVHEQRAARNRHRPHAGREPRPEPDGLGVEPQGLAPGQADTAALGRRAHRPALLARLDDELISAQVDGPLASPTATTPGTARVRS
jgi:hypothetical protein